MTNIDRRTFNKTALGAAAALTSSSALTTPSLPEGWEIRLASERGVAEHGWLSSRHTFSFARYYDPKHVGFSDLMVINEDKVAPGMGFGQHPHRAVEIFSYVLSGALEHKDSMGTHGVINPGDVQFMSAGTGVQHSEFNASRQEKVHFLQIWLSTNEPTAQPSYQQKHFSVKDKDGKLALIISPTQQDGSLKVRQDAKVYAGTLNGAQEFKYTPPKGRSTYIHVARGSVSINGFVFRAGDGIKIREDDRELVFAEATDAEVLVFDLRRSGSTDR